MSDPAPKRRRFRFSLRTLFVVMTLACWLVYNLNWIRLRHDALAHLHIGNYFGQGRAVWNNVMMQLGDARAADRDARPPWSLRLLGESGVSTIAVYGPDHARIAENFQRLFPEASVSCAESPPPSPLELRAKFYEQVRRMATAAHDIPEAADRPTASED